MTIAEQLVAARSAVTAAMARLAEEVLALPDNPDIIRLSGDHGFIVSAAAIARSRTWSASFHDYRHQYRKIAEAVRRGNPFTSFDRLERILLTHAVGEGAQKVTLHPDVATHLRRLLHDFAPPDTRRL